MRKLSRKTIVLAGVILCGMAAAGASAADRGLYLRRVEPLQEALWSLAASVETGLSYGEHQRHLQQAMVAQRATLTALPRRHTARSSWRAYVIALRAYDRAGRAWHEEMNLRAWGNDEERERLENRRQQAWADARMALDFATDRIRPAVNPVKDWQGTARLDDLDPLGRRLKALREADGADASR